MTQMSDHDPTQDRPDEEPDEASSLPKRSDDEPEIEHDFTADGVEYSLDPNWVTAARLHGGIVAAIFSIVTLVGLLIGVLASSWRGPSVLLVFAGWFVLAGALITWTQVSPALRYRRRRYRLNDLGLWIRRGLLWHAEISVPYSRIQHTDVSRGPIERWLGLSTLIVHTAGTENASVSVDGLPAARAYRIRDLLLVEVESDDAV